MRKPIPKILLALLAIGVIVLVFVLYPRKMAETKISKNVSAVASTTPVVVKPAASSTIFKLPAIKNGMVPVLKRIETREKVVFLTIDDGVYKDQSEIDILASSSLKASLFLTQTSILYEPEFFLPIQDQGSRIENHTLSHNTRMFKLSYAKQKAEICGMSDYINEQYGRRPVFFRPPGGKYSNDTLKAIADCNMKAAVTWIALIENGVIKYQTVQKLRPGDIVLMHFTPNFKKDIDAFMKAAKASGLQPTLLEDFAQAN